MAESRTRPRRTRTYIDTRTRARITELAGLGLRPVEIHARLKDDPNAVLPSRRTIEAIVRAARSVDRSGAWSLADSEGTGAKDVIEALGALIDASKGRVRVISKSEAAWIVRIRTAAPDIPALRAHSLAVVAVARSARGESVEIVEQTLAVAPWRDPTLLGRSLAGAWPVGVLATPDEMEAAAATIPGDRGAALTTILGELGMNDQDRAQRGWVRVDPNEEKR